MLGETKMMSEKWLKGFVLLIMIGVALPVVAYQTPTASASENGIKTEYTSHDPIYINGNLQFTPENGVCSGNGTENNPFIIENWDIDASSAKGIEIRNAGVYFIIRNCAVHDGGHWYPYCDGIYFWNVTNGKIDSVTSYNNACGIYLYSSSNNNITNSNVYNNNDVGISLYYPSSNNIITNCNVYNNNGGICLSPWLYSSSNNQITNCNIYNNNGVGVSVGGYSSNNQITNCNVYNNENGIHVCGNSNSISNCNVYNNDYYGIELSRSTNNNITNCRVYNNGYCGIYLSRDSPNNKLRDNVLENNTYNFAVSGCYQDVDTSNTINGKPIYYIIGQNGLTFNATMDVGYLGLISCKYITVENLIFSANIQGLLLLNTSYSTITNCAVYNNSYGIGLFDSQNNQIANCTTYNNSYGIGLFDSSNNQITNCTAYNNSWDGIHLYYSSNNNITNCTVYNNENGIPVRGNSNSISNCNVYNNDVGISSSDSNIITNCNIYNNSYGIVACSCQLTYCNLIGNSNYGFCRSGSEEGLSILIHHNNFICNGENACDPYTNYWDNDSEGNYWDDYTGTDADGNGIGDWAHSISGGGGSVDRYPLMSPVNISLSMINLPPSRVILDTPSAITLNSISLTWSQNNDFDFANYTIYQSTLQSFLGNAIKVITDRPVTSHNVTGLSPSTTYYFVVRVYDTDGLYSDSNQVSGTILLGNHAPVVNSITANPTSVSTGGTVTITVDATDEDTGDVLTYVYSCTGGTISGSESTVTWAAPNTAGSYIISVYVNDGTDNSDSKSVTVTVTTSETATGSEQTEEGKGFIPGFETASILVVLGICLLLLKRQKKESS